MRTTGSAIMVSSAATMRSHIAAIAQPPAITCPCTWAMFGFLA